MTIKLSQLKEIHIPSMYEGFQKASWPREKGLFEKYLQEQKEGKRQIWLAFYNDQFAGYGTIVYQSTYPYFQEKNIPEIVDLNVLPPFQRKGIATKIMDKLEEILFQSYSEIGIGVGLYDGYRMAQRMYVTRGYIPDAQGVHYHGKVLKYGDQITADDSLVLMFTKLNKS